MRLYYLLLAAAALLAIGLLAWSRSAESQADDGLEGYPLTGVVVEVLPEVGMLKVKHDEIRGFMPPMTMDFKVSEGDWRNAKVGDKIRARLIRNDEGDFLLNHIWPNESGEEAMSEQGRLLERRMKELGSGRYLGEGDEGPDFALYNQFGEVVSADDFRGDYVMMNFIFTRCNDAKMCPLSTSKMAQMQRLAKERGVERLAFASITLDPKYDTPGVLRQYADMYSIDGDNFSFLTGPRGAVRALIRALGVTAIEQENDVIHSLATSLISPEGMIVRRSEKSDWSPEAFLEALQQHAQAEANASSSS